MRTKVTFSGTPDFRPARGPQKGQPFLGKNWQASCASRWNEALKDPTADIEIDITNVERVDTFEWATVVAHLQRAAAYKPGGCEIAIRAFASEPSDQEIETAIRTRPVIDFLKSLGTLKAVPGATVLFRFIDGRRLPGFYAANKRGSTVLNPFVPIIASSDAARFLDDQLLQTWRNSMASEFDRSPVVASRELWRVVCHELAVNVVEHAKGHVSEQPASGLVSCHVIRPVARQTEQLPEWFSETNPWLNDKALIACRNGALEIVVADAGQGMSASLSGVFGGKQTSDLLEFSLGEFGTSKRMDDRWATETHGLGVVLHQVERYGGAMRVRSGGVEVHFCTRGGRFERKTGTRDPKATSIVSAPFVYGTQIHVVLPLFPDALPSSQRQSLLQALPPRLEPDDAKPLGHLVPVADYVQAEAAIGEVERDKFRNTWRALNLSMSDRAPGDPVVLDFSGVRWSAPQLRWALADLHNTLMRTRSALLIEVPRHLADDLERYEEEVPKQFEADDVPLRERSASAVLALDDNGGTPHLFGVVGSTKHILLSLLTRPAPLEELLSHPDALEAEIRTHLTSVPTLFEKPDRNWRCVWERQLDIQTRRVISTHFDRVAEDALAWRGAAERKANGGKDVRFFLPWTGSWLPDFLETSRILERERTADEIAQKLVARLRVRLGETISEVAVLAALTTPGLMLATAVRCWWPVLPRPVVCDIGHYALTGGFDSPLPQIVRDPEIEKIVLVQDVIDKGTLTDKVARQLRARSEKLQPIAAIALVQLHDRTDAESTSAEHSPAPSEPGSRSIGPQWTRSPGGVDRIALVKVPQPQPIASPGISVDFRVDIRSLRATPYGAGLLRGGNTASASAADMAALGDAMSPGHFVYGTRHYPVGIDIYRATKSPRGEQAIRRLTELCRGKGQDGVDLVLVPLHSQARYFWETVALLRHREGTRQSAWFLEAPPTGRDSAGELVLPGQVVRYLSAAAAKRKPLNILFVDDAVATGRTLEGVISALEAFEGGVARLQCFAFLDQRDRPEPARQGRHFAVSFEASIKAARLPLYSPETCPYCAEMRRLDEWSPKARALGFDVAADWATERVHSIAPRALDGSLDQRGEQPALESIDITGLQDPILGNQIATVPLAVWRALDLLENGFPPNGILDQLQHLVPGVRARQDGYAEYRWAILRWALANWAKIEMTGSLAAFSAALGREYQAGTLLVAPSFEGLAHHLGSTAAMDAVTAAVEWLANQENALEKAKPQDQRLDVLDRALQVFLAAAPIEQPGTVRLRDGTLRDLLARLSRAQGESADTRRVRLLYRRILRPPHEASPRWALETVAENLWRNGDIDDLRGGHKLLRQLLKEASGPDPKDPSTLYLVRSSLSLFVAALRDLKEYLPVRAQSATRVLDAAEAVLLSIRSPYLMILRDELLPGKPFLSEFGDAFHITIKAFLARLRKLEAELGGPSDRSLVVDCSVSHDEALLCPSHTLINAVHNLAIQPLARMAASQPATLQIARRNDSEDEISLALTTWFQPAENTQLSRNAHSDFLQLRKFGAEVTEPRSLNPPAIFTFILPRGFRKKG